MTNAGGIVLCGGRSSRMGRPKAWLPVGGELMLQRVVRVVGEAVGPVVVVAAPGQDVPPLPAGVRVVRDEAEGRGPLAGLAAGLAALRGECEWAYLSGCDVPLLSVGFVGRIIFAASECEPGTLPGSLSLAAKTKVEITIPLIGGRLHPLAAAYSLDVLPVVLAQLDADDLRMTRLTKLVPTRFLTEADFAHVDPELGSLRNVNTHSDYEEICRTMQTKTHDPNQS